MAQTQKKVASPKQVAFIEKLCVERQGGSVYVGTQLNAYKAGSVEDLPSHAASNVIGVLLDFPRVPNTAPAASNGAPLVEEGYYFDAAQNKVYNIVRAKSGNLYAKVMVPPAQGKKKGRWEYAPGVMKQAGEWSKITGQAAAELGTKFGWCIVCGAYLTDPKSVAAGIGPICAGKF